MNVPIFLAHGTLGQWDELIFLGVIVIFLVFMGISWVQSSKATEEDDDTTETPQESKDRFRLD